MVGKEQYDRIVIFLGKLNLKPRILPTTQGGACGVGGNSSFILTAELPTAIRGYCGTLKINVVQEPVQLLLQGFFEGLEVQYGPKIKENSFKIPMLAPR